MCKAYKISKGTYARRIKMGWNLEKVLTTVTKKQEKRIQDGFGNKFNTVNGLNSHYNIDRNTINRRAEKGWDIQVILTNKDNRLELIYIGLDGKAYYKISWSNVPVTARQIVEHYRPELLEDYDRCNPDGLYRPYKPNQKQLEEKAC